jgi:DNA-binding winged helix-turn-helix (wHTH) protein
VRVEFGEFVLDSGSRQLFRHGESIHLSRKAFDALAILLDRRPQAVTKEELHARLWPGTFVSEANLSVVMAEVRRALHDDPQAARFIRTVHRVGYAFCGGAVDAEPDAVRARQSRAWLVWNERIMALAEGENLVGRDPGCAIWLDATGVSRRHARIVVREHESSIEDLGSKNGTSLNDAPVIAARPLTDGDRLVVGDVHLQFRTANTAATTTVRMARDN